MRFLPAAILALASLPAHADAPADRIQRIEEVVLERMKSHGVPGVSVAVIEGGRIEWARGYGVRESGTNVPITPDTIFQAGSISKPVAALGALALVDSGLLTLDGDVNETLRAWQVPRNEFVARRPVTLRQLLSHGAGVTVHGFPGYSLEGALPSVVQVLEGAPPANTRSIRVDTEPGARWRYSGGGYTIVQQLMTEAAGKPFEQLMAERVLAPAGMDSSLFAQPLPPVLLPGAALGHTLGQRVPWGAHAYPELAAAGLWTTPSDLARLAIALQRVIAGEASPLLSASNAAEMFRPQSGTWGLGFQLQGSGDTLRFQHSGINEGFNALLVAYASTGQGAVVMANGDTGNELTGEILGAIAAEYAWRR